MQDFPISPCEMLASLWRNRSLVRALVKREVFARYRGSVIGLAWSFLNPLLMLSVYTFVFSGVFSSRWASAEDSKLDFAIILFVGLIVHGLFAECINRAPALVVSNVNYVKKVIFPLEILPWVSLGAALFHMAVSLIVLLLAQVAINQVLPWTAVFFPLVLLPLVLGIMGLTWFFSALGVYLRDLGQVTAIFTTIMLFMSAVFFPISALPERYHIWLHLNPLAVIIQEARKVLVMGQLPDFSLLAAILGLGALFAWAGFAWFQRTRRGFADVL
ncbi:ABC transporter permease [Pseudomonas fakonensis]|uniref:Transport permease protein n=1 Tax=Pseudomonas fakonensis TaxID=2842355 RepID=A0ABX8N6S5_9PSED|nr:ABC transporter permease [Pseudomonas fakonensis]QXH51540.1 ABC transporter permease [Pseudomonas fakonensis]